VISNPLTTPESIGFLKPVTRILIYLREVIELETPPAIVRVSFSKVQETLSLSSSSGWHLIEPCKKDICLERVVSPKFQIGNFI